MAVIATALLTGCAGRCFLLVAAYTQRWMPAPVQILRRERPVAFAAACGWLVALIGLLAGGVTFGSGMPRPRVC